MERESVNRFKINEAHKNEWSSKFYNQLKETKGMKSFRGSAFFLEIAHGLKGIKLLGCNGMDIEYPGGDQFDTNWNTIYQRDYGKSFGNYLEAKRFNMDSIASMRRNRENDGLLATRARMVDWMIEVFLVYQEKGSNEITYFRALTLLDILINSGQIKESQIHLYGIACMYLASNILDSIPMSIGEAKRDLAHDQFTGNLILKYINNALSIFDFNLLHPTWIEYLDKLIYDIFGDFRDSLTNLSLRSSAVFVLNACAYDVRFYSWNPYHLAAIALLFGINCMEREFETKLGKDPHNPDYLEAKVRFRGLIETVLTTQKLNGEAAQAKMAELGIYLEILQARVTEQDYPHLAKLFRMN